jgi:hypothetical protein
MKTGCGSVITSCWVIGMWCGGDCGQHHPTQRHEAEGARINTEEQESVPDRLAPVAARTGPHSSARDATPLHQPAESTTQATEIRSEGTRKQPQRQADQLGATARVPFACAMGVREGNATQTLIRGVDVARPNAAAKHGLSTMW